MEQRDLIGIFFFPASAFYRLGGLMLRVRCFSAFRSNDFHCNFALAAEDGGDGVFQNGEIVTGNPIPGHAGLRAENEFGVGQGERLDRIEPFEGGTGELISHIIENLLPDSLQL